MEQRLRRVFDPENGWWAFLGRGVDLVGLSLVWAFLCIPVLTFGPATSALYYTVVKCFRQKEKNTFAIFWRAFRGNLKQGIKATLISVPILLLLAAGYSIMKANWGTDFGAVMFVAYDIALVVPLGILVWLFPLTISHFSNKFQRAISCTDSNG